jgi:phage shock protein A
MAEAAGRARAHDATVGTEPGPATPRKAAAAVAYYERELAAARTAVTNGEAKVAKMRELLAGAETSLAEAREAVPGAERNLAAARARLAELGG